MIVLYGHWWSGPHDFSLRELVLFVYYYLEVVEEIERFQLAFSDLFNPPCRSGHGATFIVLRPKKKKKKRAMVKLHRRPQSLLYLRTVFLKFLKCYADFWLNCHRNCLRLVTLSEEILIVWFWYFFIDHKKVWIEEGDNIHIQLLFWCAYFEFFFYI